MKKKSGAMTNANARTRFHLSSLALICCSPWKHRVLSFSFRPSSVSPHIKTTARTRTYPLLSSLSLPTPTEEQGQTLDDYLPPSHPLISLLTTTADVSDPRRTRATEGSSRPPEFRYEWGTWIDQEKLDDVMEALGGNSIDHRRVRRCDGWKFGNDNAW